MDVANDEYMRTVAVVRTGENARDIERGIRDLMQVRNYITANYPELVESVADIDYYIANAAYRINNVPLMESMIQKHYYADHRFKKLYRTHRETETANVWHNIVRSNADDLQKTFVRSLSCVILTCIVVSIICRTK